MPTDYNFKVELRPAKREDGVWSYLPASDPELTHDLTCPVALIPFHVRKLVANVFRKDACVYVRLADRKARKPAGFDRVTRNIHFVAKDT